ncbi:GTP-binding protein LepA [Mycoplasmoides fastidiosum]|uniref:Elongation factor 4 n=1 Tax=Mycoplasmoides fastidiosum TaxID=92758 RepID=A0ABU0LYC9_9BACT|nr:translation elongation factor 4 [Mycoplasmoides fastidiosum]MDQ0513693.1 GTP-binding protein LepA [Mycoplasmoides fastidiosum]UUD37884.1 translation elongation factor 4 [Mycoplasmoides fastidiosum]
MNKKIKNFCIIAHIDHGKSTLSDRLIEMTGALSKREMTAQVLDSMELERERGITIKLNAVRLNYTDPVTKEKYELNLIDTPGHADFSYEVSRSLAACEAALLVVDASQGVQAQTISNVYLALENELEIIPVLNKVDLPGANVEATIQEIESRIGLSCEYAPQISAKSGLNCQQVLDAIIKYVPNAPTPNDRPLKALVFDSYYDPYKGAIVFIRIIEGVLKTNDKIKFMVSGKEMQAVLLGIKTPKFEEVAELRAGEVGYFAANIKNLHDVAVGDTITHTDAPAAEALPGYRKVLPMVFCGLYPIDTSQYAAFKDAMNKIALSDASLVFEYETSQVLGFGIRCGFLGLLHMDIIKERLSREYKIDLIATAPSVSYEIHLTNGEILTIHNPTDLPHLSRIKTIYEPYVKTKISIPEKYTGKIMELCQERRGIYSDMLLDSAVQRTIVYEMPLSELIYGFHDRMKSVSNGYASLDYELIGLRPAKLQKVDLLLNGNPVDALSFITDRESAYYKAKRIVEKLKEIIPQHLFEIPVQAAIGTKVIARETIKALKKNVTAKCYGGDITRKRKLWDKQKEGKKRMKAIGVVDVPQDVFIKILEE